MLSAGATRGQRLRPTHHSMMRAIMVMITPVLVSAIYKRGQRLRCHSATANSTTNGMEMTRAAL